MSCYIEFSLSIFFLSDLARLEDFFQKPVKIQFRAIRLESVYFFLDVDFFKNPEMRKNKGADQAVKIMKEILKRQCNVI